MTETETPKARKPRARKSRAKAVAARAPLRRIALWLGRGMAGIVGFFLLLIVLFSFVNPPTTLYQMSERARLGGVQQDWADWDEIAPEMGRAAVAAEDANFCLHWGFDMTAIRAAIDQGGNRGASTISQQVVKNVFLWHGRSWLRKAMEAAITPVVELIWSKQRILEVYLNVAEFDEGVFGVQAAAQRSFGVDARDLTPGQSARLAAVLPDPKTRDAADPGPFVRRRAGQIISGAETIAADGRAGCFE